MNNVCKWLGVFSIGLVLMTTACARPIKEMAKVSKVKVSYFSKTDNDSWMDGAIIGGLMLGARGAVIGGAMSYSENEKKTKIFRANCKFIATIGIRRYRVQTSSYMDKCSSLHDGDLTEVVLLNNNKVRWPSTGVPQLVEELPPGS